MNKDKEFNCFFEKIEGQIWNTEKIFNTVDSWNEQDGVALFFRLDAGEPPTVTSPICDDWDKDYFTHWMELPDAFKTGYRVACIKSGILTLEE